MFLMAITRLNGRDKTMATRKSSELTGNRQEHELGHQTRVTKGGGGGGGGGDGDSRQVRRTGGGALRSVVVEATRWSEFGNNGGAGGFRLGCAWGGKKKNEGLWS